MIDGGEELLIIGMLTVILVVIGIAENYMHKRNIDRIPVRILVNGTRGKTTVSLLIAEAMNAHGIRTIVKTTGSEARIILPSGEVRTIRRRGKARIIEMIPFFRLAADEKVQCAVVECMALRAENQRIIAKSLVKPTHVVMLNAFIDHIAEVGRTEEETVWTLSQSIAENAELYSADDTFSGMGRSFHKVIVEDISIEGGSIPINMESFSAAAAVCSSFGISKDEVVSAAMSVKPDIGLLHDFICDNGALFMPSFSINDRTCMERAVRSAASSGRRVNVIFSNREDREYRILLLASILSSASDDVGKVFCIGDYKKKCASYFRRHSKADAEAVDMDKLVEIMNKAGNEEVFLGLGNIKGDGEKLISFFSKVQEV